MSITYLILNLLYSCAERDKKNPLDPDANGDHPISLYVTSHEKRVSLSWSQPSISGYNGFKIYRRDHPDSSFKLITLTLPIRFNYNDYDVEYGVEYSYYVTILGEGTESSPSPTVSIRPGPGYNWIVDKWGYQVVKATYDCNYFLLSYYTDWMPADIAADPENKIAVITEPLDSKIEIINTESLELLASLTNNDEFFIDYPYVVEFEPLNKFFWIADSGGSFYRISSVDYSVDLIQANINKPIDVTLDSHSEVINVLDGINNSIWRFNYDGTYIENLNQIGGYQLIHPKKIIFDYSDSQFWLIERYNNKDYIYAGYIQNSQISLVDSFEYVQDMSVCPLDLSNWIITYQSSNATIMQLSKDGNRQLELSGFNNPYQLTHNPYDGTLLVVDTGNYRVVHFGWELEEIGNYSHLNYPIRIAVE